ncbi:MAG: hypothetical protein RLZZ15_2196 [Verrucomicrobiota bacterium]|jgi:Spy/CpxP family protein refolding chaperone
MNSPKKLAALLLLALTAAFAGCQMTPQNNTAIPWSKPAGWEGQIPGMGQPGGR